ncbi:hypothetical protein QYF36_001559 [Acer negundo]|nr:hypothetical protein QYF36_001559 [Acer negundo]
MKDSLKIRGWAFSYTHGFFGASKETCDVKSNVKGSAGVGIQDNDLQGQNPAHILPCKPPLPIIFITNTNSNQHLYYCNQTRIKRVADFMLVFEPNIHQNKSLHLNCRRLVLSLSILKLYWHLNRLIFDAYKFACL